LQLGWVSYEADHNEQFPANISSYAYGRALNISNSWVLGNAQRDESPNNLMGGSLNAYVPAVGSYLCPSDRAKTKGSNPRLHTRSYSAQWWLGANFTVNGQVWSDPNPRGQAQKRSAGQVAAPGPVEIFALIDDHEQSVDDGIFVIGGCEWFDYPSDRHRRGANLSFLDGHVEHHRWVIAKVVPWDWSYYLNPVWSREVPDHTWLAAHLPTR
jgi:prepilin-type processing-associated H-X9-DG protein